MLAWNDYNKSRKKGGLYKDTSKEERAKELNNVICPHCKYQNHKKWIEIYGKCHLCGRVLGKRIFIKDMLKRCNNG